MDIEILFEDNHVLVLKKEPGMLSQGDASHDPNLLDLGKEYLRVSKQKPGEAYLGLVHRLDRNTGGILVFAKTSKAASRLSESMKLSAFAKKYYAIVAGVPKSSDSWTDYLGKDESTHKAYVTKESSGKISKLTYRVVNSFPYQGKEYSFVEVELETGRFHQIRIQFASRGFPLYGDIKYGGTKNKSNPNFIALWNYELQFPHPITKQLCTFHLSPEGDIWDVVTKK